MSGPPAAPERLSRERILDAAMTLAMAEGVGALSMRRIAAELHTGAMSLYNHVPDKQALLDALVDRMLSDVELPESSEPRAIAWGWADTLRRTLLIHRPLVPLLFLPRETSPLSQVGRDLVVALMRTGVALDDAVMVARVLGQFLAGSIMFDTQARRRSAEPPVSGDETFRVGLEAMLDGLAGLLTPRTS